MQAVAFYFFSFTAVVSAFFVIFSSRPTRALLSLILTMVSLSCLYISLGAPFVAMINLIVYAGAVLVLFLFVIMLQGLGAQDIPLAVRFKKLFTFSAFLLPGFFLFAFYFLAGKTSNSPWTPIEGDPKSIGMLLFSQYLLPFELISILLILAIFAAVTLAKRDAE